MKMRVFDTNSSANVQIINGTYDPQNQQFIISEGAEATDEDVSSEEMYGESTTDGIIKTEYTTEECMPDDGLDLYEEQTVESSYSGLTDYNILKDIVVRNVKNEGELMIHSNFVVVEDKIIEEEAAAVHIIKHGYVEDDPNEYEVDHQIHTMAYEEHGDIETQEEIGYNCGKCPLKFESPNDLQSHRKTHNAKPVSCQICSKKFKKELGMKIHMSLKHERPVPKVMLKTSGNDIKPTTSKKRGRRKLNNDETNFAKRYECNNCPRYFTEYTHLKNHLKFHNQWKPKPFECDLCFKCFGQRGNLETHKKIHLGHKPFHCHLCDRAFFQKGNLVTHLKIHAQNENTFKRPVKLKKPKTMVTIKTQTHSVPSSSYIAQPIMKKFTCEVCSKAFLQLTNLQTHMRTHTGNRPFSCTYCTKSFTQIGNLQKHLKIHTGERPFKCEVCAKAFVQKCQMQKHMRVHNIGPTMKPGRKKTVPRIKVFQCTNCSKKYKQNVNLKKHMEKCIIQHILPTQLLFTQGNTKQIHFERVANPQLQQTPKIEPNDSEYLSDSSDNASVSGNASSDSSNNSSDSDSSDLEMI